MINLFMKRDDDEDVGRGEGGLNIGGKLVYLNHHPIELVLSKNCRWKKGK